MHRLARGPTSSCLPLVALSARAFTRDMPMSHSCQAASLRCCSPAAAQPKQGTVSLLRTACERCAPSCTALMAADPQGLTLCQQIGASGFLRSYPYLHTVISTSATLQHASSCVPSLGPWLTCVLTELERAQQLDGGSDGLPNLCRAGRRLGREDQRLQAELRAPFV